MEGVIKLNQKVIVGWTLALAAVNWGLVGLLNVNLVEVIFGSIGILPKVVYILIGIAGLVKIYNLTMKK